LQDVYEQNLSILGIRKGFQRRYRIPARRGIVSAMFLGAILFGQGTHLNLFTWGSVVPPRSIATSSPRDWRTEPFQSSASLGAEIAPGGSAEITQAPSGVESDAAEYRSLAQGDKLIIREVFGLGVKTIMIDPGHGGSASGAIGKGGTAEKTITLDVARKLKAALERDTHYRVLMVREDDRDVPLKNRVKMANEAKADLFISIHVNALPARPIDIVETYYFGPTRDKKTLELAAEVNEGSDYSYSEYNEIIKEITNQLKYQESKRLARSIQDTLYRNMKARNADVLNFGVKRAPFVVLLGVEMPAVLVEVACLSNADEENRLKEAAYRENIAEYIRRGIIRYLDENRNRS
jgi:N-acetylmuramoyl-L-alanine amidase